MNGRELLEGMSFVHSKYVQETEDYRVEKGNFGKITRFLLIAAVLSSLLATTAFAYVGFTKYENPVRMLKVFFGSDEYHVDDGGIHTRNYYDLEWDVVEPTVEHLPVDPNVVDDVAPFISSVGQSISYKDYTLTIEAHQYDSATNSGVIYYHIDNPNGVKGYETQFWGEVWWPGGELVNLHGASWMNYIIEDETTDTKLSVAAYYCDADMESRIIEVMFFNEKEHALKLNLNDGGGMKFKSYLNSITVSPIAIKIHLPDFDFLGYTFEDGAYMPPVDDVKLDYLAVCFADGTKFVVKNEEEGGTINNTKYALININIDVSYVFNRLVDVESVTSVIINDNEFQVK